MAGTARSHVMALLFLAMLGWWGFTDDNEVKSGDTATETGHEAQPETSGANGKHTGSEGEDLRLKTAKQALVEAETYLAENAEDLVGAKERYLQIAQTYSDLPVISAKAEQRATSIQKSLDRLEKERLEQEQLDACPR